MLCYICCCCFIGALYSDLPVFVKHNLEGLGLQVITGNLLGVFPQRQRTFLLWPTKL